MSDFIREVDEDYRRERAANFLKRFQIPLALLVVAVIAGAGGWRWYADHRRATAEAADARYHAAGVAAKAGQTAESEATFKGLAGDGPDGYALLAKLRAAEVLGSRDPEAAAKALDAIASDEGTGSAALRDLARYRGALLRVDREESKAFDAQYGRFALDSFTFHDGMRELLALAALKRDDRDAAGKYLDDILIDPLAPPALRNRAQAFRDLVKAGPATAIPSAPTPATVTPVGAAPAAAPPAAAPQFEPIAPVGRMPQSAMPPSGEAAAPEPPEAAPASAAQAPSTAPDPVPGPTSTAPQSTPPVPATPAK